MFIMLLAPFVLCKLFGIPNRKKSIFLSPNVLLRLFFILIFCWLRLLLLRKQTLELQRDSPHQQGLLEGPIETRHAELVEEQDRYGGKWGFQSHSSAETPVRKQNINQVNSHKAVF